jgi:hypothetical protein
MIRPNLSAVRLGGLLAGVSLLAGCMTAKIEESRTLPTAIGSGEAVVILAKPKVDGVSSEDDFMDCVGDKLGAGTGINVRPNNAFVDSLFPWFEPSTAPQRAEGVRRLLARPLVAERIAQTGVRYLIWLDGVTRKVDSGGSMSCAIGPGVGGCLGFGWWEKTSDYEATIWDLNEAKSAGTVSAKVNGTSAMLGVLVPVPFIARVQSAACDRMASQLQQFLKGGDYTAAAAGGGL